MTTKWEQLDKLEFEAVFPKSNDIFLTSFYLLFIRYQKHQKEVFLFVHLIY